MPCSPHVSQTYGLGIDPLGLAILDHTYTPCVGGPRCILPVLRQQSFKTLGKTSAEFISLTTQYMGEQEVILTLCLRVDTCTCLWHWKFGHSYHLTRRSPERCQGFLIDCWIMVVIWLCCEKEHIWSYMMPSDNDLLKESFAQSSPDFLGDYVSRPQRAIGTQTYSIE